MRCLKLSLSKLFACAVLIAAYYLLPAECSSEAHADTSSHPQVAPTETAVAAQTVAATATESAFMAAVSRAYMNCLRDVDENSAELIANPKARESEERHMRKFCDGRRESCIANGNDAQCKLFLEDYTQ